MELNEDSLNQMIENIKKLLNLNKIKDAFVLLDKHIAPISNDLDNSIILNHGIFTSVKNEEALMTAEQFRVENAKISRNLLGVMDRVPDELEVKRIMGEIRPSIFQITKEEGLEKIFGENNLKKISWLQGALNASRSVCQVRLANNDKPIGTGFVLKGGYLMTNCHVIPSQNAVDKVKIVFDFEENLLGQVRETSAFLLDKNDAKFSPINEFDYAYIKILDPDNTLTQWGTLKVNTSAAAKPKKDDQVSIIQHPLGQTKQIALTANKVIDVNDATNKILYETDTERGSSGSPVFNELWEVIALHHAGRTEEEGGLVTSTGERRGANEGILINVIANSIGKAI